MRDPIESDITLPLTWLPNIEREATILFTFSLNFKCG